MVHLRQSAKPPQPEHAALREEFWRAPDDALFTRKQIAAVLCRSVAWLEAFVRKGGGPTYAKVGAHRVLYRKGDVVTWWNNYITRWTNGANQIGSADALA
jgi:hypothetical protein